MAKRQVLGIECINGPIRYAVVGGLLQAGAHILPSIEQYISLSTDSVLVQSIGNHCSALCLVVE